MPKASLQYVTHRFANCGFREDCELLGEDCAWTGRRGGEAPGRNAAKRSGQRSRGSDRLVEPVVVESVEQILPQRLAQWPRTSHDRAMRQLSSTPAEQRATIAGVIVRLAGSVDPAAGAGRDGHEWAARVHPEDRGIDAGRSDAGFTRIKAIEAVGRLRASAASATLQQILEAKQVWRWTYHANCELPPPKRCKKSNRRWRWRKLPRAGWTARNWCWSRLIRNQMRR